MRCALVLSAMALVSVLAAAGCSTMAQQPSEAPGKTGDVATGAGVTRSEITLGALTDHSGPFKELGLGVVQGNQIWINETNADGGICGRQIKLAIRDHGHDVSKAQAHYPALEPNVLGFMEIMGSRVSAALSQKLVYNETTAVALSQSSELLANPYMIIPGTTYDVEMINGLSYLMETGRLRDGDTIGHIWIDDEYGANGLRGTQYFAEKHRLTVRDAKITSSDSDLRDVVAGFAGDPRVTAIALTTTPEQAASTAVANQQLGLNVPMIGNNSVFTPQLLEGPAAAGLVNLTVVASSVPFSSDVPQAQQIAQTFQQGGFEGRPNSGVPYGYAIGEIWGELLQRACNNGDLTRAGIQEALRQSVDITTDKLIADLDFAEPGAPAAREVYVGVPDALVPGGIRLVKPLFVAPEARSYAAPHQTGA
ncbi:MAG TPA: ABC transporter substrate-binding protein [Pseudonocardiaceae bacterium]|nr:ABC transporter substrate-binding protein [Pseudonocardiaceae bacterium]